MESYQHGLAKHVLASWLREQSKGRGNRWASFGPFGWCPNRGEQHFGVWVEYPIGKNGEGITEVWDESDWSERLYGESETQETRPPTFDECVKLGCPPALIFDVAIQHKGWIIYGIEIVHKNGIDQKKLQKIREMDRMSSVSVYTTTATFIMHQVGIPADPSRGFEQVF